MKLEKYKWMYQRISTPFIIILFFWFIYNIYKLQNYNYETITVFFDKNLNLLLFSILVLLTLIHTSIEVFHAIHDYFSDAKNKNIIKFTVYILYLAILTSILFFIIQFVQQ